MTQIAFPLKPNMKNAAVADLHAALVDLGLEITDDEREKQLFGKSTREAVRKFQTHHQLRASGIVDQATADLIGQLIAAGRGDGETKPGGSTVSTVSGKVVSGSRAGVAGLRVEIIDRNVGADKLLGQVVTDEDGTFAAAFSIANIGKPQADLQARAYSGKVLVGVSEVRYNASTRETLNVAVLETGLSALKSEHETLTRVLAEHFDGKLRDLQETDERRDITYLANKTGWDARAVAMAALADQFSQRAGGKLDPDFFYALFRSGVPVHEATLYRLDADTVTVALKKAIKDGVMSAARARAIPQLVKEFLTLSEQRWLTGPAPAGVSPLKEMLTVSRLSEARQQQFAQLYTTHRNDMPALWAAVEEAFDQKTSSRLQVDGKLGFLTLNNAALMQRVHQVAGSGGIADPVQLAQLGLHRAQQWNELLGQDIEVPAEIPGDTAGQKRAHYADYLAAQVRLSYPTASIADLIKRKDMPLLNRQGKPVSASVSKAVQGFLNQHQGKFEIGVNPVEQYLKTNQIELESEALEQVKKLQRVYQITSSDQAMTGLMKRGLDAAYHVVRHRKDSFVETYAKDLGGDGPARQVYDRAVQIHNAVLNVAISYITASNAPGIGVHSPAQIVDAAPRAELAGDVIAYSKLEDLFGETDYCACDHCRSILSPAAYLVDLLNFIDVPPTEAGMENPQTVLLQRRPDIQHLPLTCENTNTALPYIDVVNEALEYFVANEVEALTLNGYFGHDTGSALSADLLASPQSYSDGVRDAAYASLRGENFPPPLPFHQPLESLRRYFAKFEVALPLAMERLRQSDDLERGANPYGWRDILMEELGLSRPEHQLLTASSAAPNTLAPIYGFPPATTDAHIVNGDPPTHIPVLSNAREFTRRVGISYSELVDVLKTKFVNPASDLIPHLEKLGVPFAALKALKDAPGNSGDAEFDALLPTGAGAPDPAEYDNDIKAWVKNDENYSRIMSLITLVDPTGSGDDCAFDNLELRHAQPMADENDITTRLNAVEFVRMLRFIRLWRKTGWTIEQTDAAICALYRADLNPLTTADLDTIAELDAGFLTLLPRLGVAHRVMKRLNLTVKRDLLPLLVCWSDIGTHGANALYRTMFLNPTVANQDAAFADDGYGNFLDGAEQIGTHADTLRSAFNVTADEFERIIEAIGFDATTALTIANVSKIFRYGWLARKLKISVTELVLLTALSGLDPFAAADPTDAAMTQLIALIQTMKARAIKTQAALYLIWNQDLSGRSAPDPASIAEQARLLRGDFAAIDDQFATAQDAGEDASRARMQLVYGQETSDAFFELLDDVIVMDVPYTHSATTLEGAITAADAGIAYDDFKHRISHAGILADAGRVALKAVAGVSDEFRNAVDALFDHGQVLMGLFFTRYPELKAPFDAAVVLPAEQRHAAFLAAFQPELSRMRKRQQAAQRLSTAAAVDLEFTRAILDPASAPYPVHAAGQVNRPALDDIVALETPGLTAQFYYSNTATGTADLEVPNVATLKYDADNPLPPNATTPGDPISGMWRGMLEAAEAGFYNIVIEADDGASVTLEIDGQVRPLIQNGDVRRNSDPLELTAGSLHEIVLTLEQVKDAIKVEWETPKRSREVIPPRYLYPTILLTPFTDAYVRFLKAASLRAALKLTASEVAQIATHTDYQVAGDNWLNALPVSGEAADPVALLKPFRALLDFARIKAELAPDDERLLEVIKDPVAASAGDDSKLYALTRWDAQSLTALLSHFGGTIAGLSQLDLFARIYDAFVLLQTIRISASSLLDATTNEPEANTVRDFQAALRARYAAADWREVVRPINDEMRGLQRDALVGYILHQMRSQPETEHIDSADKLFEYFLMDVEMEPCMETSRVRHALSTVQLFIERCLMNLETRVSPSSLNAQQWEWMKRYRVWEANRKVFLFPENWLEPELRDDKSPIFKEIESELLQGDITEDSAATALLNYLTKLEEIAKLEPCGIYHVEGDPALRTGDVEHVVSRTSGAHRKYYYRRREGGAWSPWEQVKVDIEDNPVMPVVWNNRLFVFWLRLVKQTPVNPENLPTTSTKSGAVSGLSMSDIKSDAKSSATGHARMTVFAVLCYSEYYNGKWQPAKTSDPDRPTRLGTFPVDPRASGAFDRSKLLMSTVVKDDMLRIIIYNQGGSSFLMYNTHSLPVRGEDAEVYFYGDATKWRSLYEGADHLFYINYWSNDPATPVTTRDVLKGKLHERSMQPLHPLQNSWLAPFFYCDSRHAFYVTTVQKSSRVWDFHDYGFAIDTGALATRGIAPLVKELPPVRVGPTGWGGAGPIGPDPDPGVIDSSPIERFFTEDVYIDKGIGISGNVMYGERAVGPAGGITEVIVSK